jgi:hypothetical protein
VIIGVVVAAEGVGGFLAEIGVLGEAHDVLAVGTRTRWCFCCQFVGSARIFVANHVLSSPLLQNIESTASDPTGPAPSAS